MVYVSPETMVKQRSLAKWRDSVRGSCVDTGADRDAKNNLHFADKFLLINICA